jgi:hypothetical protein
MFVQQLCGWGWVVKDMGQVAKASALREATRIQITPL